MDALVAAHSGLRWLVLVGLVAVLAWALPARGAGLPGWVRIVRVVLQVQVVLGLVLYLANQGWSQGAFIALWHPAAMIAAVGVFEVGTARAGRGEGPPRALALATAASLALVLAAIPWARGLA